MGAGKSKAGSGQGGIPNINQTSVSTLSDDALKALENEFDKRISKVKDELYTIARENQANITNMPRKYYQKKNEQVALENKRNIIIDERLKRKKSQKRTNTKNNKTFVNSFGEATKRYVTTSTYERNRRRIEKDIMNFIGKR